MLATLELLIAITRVLLSVVGASSELTLSASVVLPALPEAVVASVVLVVLIRSAISELYVLVALFKDVATDCLVV